MSEHASLTCRLGVTDSGEAALTMSLCCQEHGNEVVQRWHPLLSDAPWMSEQECRDGSHVSLALCQSVGECWAGYVGSSSLVEQLVARPEYRPHLNNRTSGTVERFSFHVGRPVIDQWRHQVAASHGVLLTFFDMRSSSHSSGMQLWVPDHNIQVLEWCDRPADAGVLCQPDAERQLLRTPSLRIRDSA